jgi:hypothetical protein
MRYLQMQPNELSQNCLNTVWGKFTERNNKTQSKIISDRQELYRFLSTPGIEVTSFLFASDEVVWVSWRYSDEKQVPNLKHKRSVGRVCDGRGMSSSVPFSR